MSNRSFANSLPAFPPTVAPTKLPSERPISSALLRLSTPNVPNRLAIALAAVFVLSGTTQSMAEIICKPALTIKETRFSEARNQQRIWTAALAVDASRCATRSGPFEIKFIRLKETGPDLLFSESFMWRPGQVEVSVDFWWDESVHHYWIGEVVPCGCAD
jgi:hypothetical protein